MKVISNYDDLVTIDKNFKYKNITLKSIKISCKHN